MVIGTNSFRTRKTGREVIHTTHKKYFASTNFSVVVYSLRVFGDETVTVGLYANNADSAALR